jgi:hypothetical protein
MSSTIASQQVSFWSVHEHVQPLLDLVGDWPVVGSPAWCALPDGPAKLAALYDAAQHHALRLELNQEARAQASHAISAAENWGSVAREIRSRNDFYSERPWLRRAAS